MRGLGSFVILKPRLAPAQIRDLVSVGVVLRWVAIAFAGLAGYVVPRVPRYLTAEILAAIIYNGLVIALEKRTDDRSLPRLALAITVIDQIFCLTFIALYNVTPGSHQVAAYFPAMIEAVGFFGALGAALSSACFLAGVVATELAGALLWQTGVDAAGIFSATMIIVLIGACLGAVNHVLMRPPDVVGQANDGIRAQPLTSGVRLSDRDQDVLRLLALGCSNAMIASQLGVSERAIKACVEKLLARLKARNRAEAVAAAARLELV